MSLFVIGKQKRIGGGECARQYCALIEQQKIKNTVTQKVPYGA